MPTPGRGFCPESASCSGLFGRHSWGLAVRASSLVSPISRLAGGNRELLRSGRYDLAHPSKDNGGSLDLSRHSFARS
ncbi:hypothetical protein MTP99_010476 [Tenebrio molitor]|nr:hypothetical protein MTP99_010476 [Tenebrio molitor]